jgi:hypothetical protein
LAGNENGELLMFVNHDDKILFVHVPKSAGSTIHIYFKDYYKLVGEERLDPVPEIHHMTYRDIIRQNPTLKTYFSFGFVRNPWDRLLSGFLDFKQNRRNFQNIDFKYFVHHLRDSNILNDVHFRPQKEFLVDGEDAVSFIGRFENLADDFMTICNNINIDFIPLRKHRSTKHDEYTKYYDKEMIKIVENIFKEDIKYFNYEFGAK